MRSEIRIRSALSPFAISIRLWRIRGEGGIGGRQKDEVEKEAQEQEERR